MVGFVTYVCRMNTAQRRAQVNEYAQDIPQDALDRRKRLIQITMVVAAAVLGAATGAFFGVTPLTLRMLAIVGSSAFHGLVIPKIFERFYCVLTLLAARTLTPRHAMV